eukprot:12407404-Karenia_brevis.AAC.1
MNYRWQDEAPEMSVLTDANWAGNKRSRKSTSGGVICIGCHLIKSWSKTQSLIALSSAESELYACIKATAEGLGIAAAMRDFGEEVSGRVYADASAALGIISRKGLGKVRHIDTSYLWIQEVSAKRKVAFEKIEGAKNQADMMTKNISAA